MSETRVKDLDWESWEARARSLSKEQLIQFIKKKTVRSKKDLEKKIEIEAREKKVVESYVSLLSSILPTYDDDANTKRGQVKHRYFDDTQGKLKQIEILEEEKKAISRNIQEVRKPKQECMHINVSTI